MVHLLHRLYGVDAPGSCIDLSHPNPKPQVSREIATQTPRGRSAYCSCTDETSGYPAHPNPVQASTTKATDLVRHDCPFRRFRAVAKLPLGNFSIWIVILSVTKIGLLPCCY